ncbi:Glycerol-3-phosphate responsive antiterminator [Petrocella atlantisensis]|uniref:Glycerol-3-phosphate responsive antiterminator n=1 Tax=Petrocella atlantisensis TaxID=2173034 RepID=A0A3P7RW17_9FIRM|nr:glycerol-3-phosphate responsive antiterminator [Petrocella atlantisensis]MCF8019453.1 glycerol-3-phosphate responsive antiterminator [Vallitaleaceae bacterium]VDN46966.1 Glycerol-3-phosphate responsive antiterminator [Petrocella atlantisensis]
MSKSQMNDILIDNPIIAAVSSREHMEKAIKSPCNVIFMLYGDIMTLKDDVNYAKANDKKVFIHIDLIHGFSHDNYALRYIQSEIDPTGIVTTKSSLTKKAKEMDMLVIQRLFMLDSKSINAGIATIKGMKPDAVEIMPGIIPKITTVMSKELSVPIIVGGLIEYKQEVLEALKAGATSISTSSEKIWYS